MKDETEMVVRDLIIIIVDHLIMTTVDAVTDVMELAEKLLALRNGGKDDEIVKVDKKTAPTETNAVEGEVVVFLTAMGSQVVRRLTKKI